MLYKYYGATEETWPGEEMSGTWGGCAAFLQAAIASFHSSEETETNMIPGAIENANRLIDPVGFPESDFVTIANFAIGGAYPYDGFGNIDGLFWQSKGFYRVKFSGGFKWFTHYQGLNGWTNAELVSFIASNPYPEWIGVNAIYYNPLGNYYFDFPSWAPVPSWYHFATLIKADGTTYGKEIAPTLDPVPLKPPIPPGTLITPKPAGYAFEMEIWRQEPIDPDPLYNYYPRQFLNYSNLLTELEDFPDISPSAELAEIGGGTVTPVYFYPWLTEPPTDQQFSLSQLEALTTFPDIDPDTGEPHPQAGELIFDPDTDLGEIMPDSIRLKEIHSALEAGRYGVHPDPTKAQLNNIGRLVEALAYVLGINLDSDGKNLPFPDPEYLKPEDVAKLKHLKTSQFAAFDGDKGMQAATLYDIRSNVAVTDKFGKKVIQPGGAVKVWNLAQWLDQGADDTEAQLGGASLASLQVPTGDGKTYHQYQGLGHAIQDCLFMLSVESKRVDELVIQAARTIHLAQQILMGLGLPLRPDTIDFLIGAETATAEDPPQIGVAPVASLDPSAPTITSLFGITLANLSRLVAGTIGYQVTGVSAAADNGNDEIPDPFDFEDDLPGINL